MSKWNVPMFLLTGVPLIEGKSSGAGGCVELVILAFLGLLLLALVALLVIGIACAFMWQPV